MTINPITRSLSIRPLAHLVLCVLAGALLMAGDAAARPAVPVLDVTQQTLPSTLAAGGKGSYFIAVENMGLKATNGTVTVTDVLPAGVTFTGAESGYGGAIWSCPAAPGDSTVTCTLQYGQVRGGGGPDIPAHASTYAPLQIFFDVDPGASGQLVNTVTVSGGGSDGDDVSTVATRVRPAADAAASLFDVAGFSGWASNLDGSAARQAGAHPDLTTTISFATELRGARGPAVVGNVKDVTVDLPPGVVGNATAVPTCKPTDLADVVRAAQCAAETQVGTADVFSAIGNPTVGVWQEVPVFNIEPPVGSPARFGMQFNRVVVTIDPVVKAGGRYSISAKLSGISQSVPLISSKVTLWGVPADPVHDWLRAHPTPDGPILGTPSASKPKPFLTAPTSCTGTPLQTSMTARSWQDPDRLVSASFDTDFDGDPITTTGCDGLSFTPTVTAVPTSTQPDAPTGLNVQIDSPQSLDNPGGLASAQLRNVKVTLPEGMTINPGSADGLGACSDQQLGLGTDDPPSCPDSAKIGSVTAKTPLLAEELSGGVYVRSQASSDPESGDMFRMALVLENKERGILVKLPGAIRVNKDTGRIVTEFADNPQLPVEQIKLSLKAGPRAPLATPSTCGTKSIDMELTSWAGHDVKTSSSFDVACTGGLGGFSPSLKAGTSNPIGGAFSPFTLAITKPDGNAALTGLSMSLPTGLLAKLKGNLGTQVGTVTATAGPGSNPFALPGQVFLEGRYGDAPFSLRVVVPAKAGPFDLGTVEVRQKIYVDPITAQVTVVSDPVPAIVKGVPVRLQRLDVNVDKAGFIINPTSCAPKAFTGTLGAADGQTAPINVRFQVGSCSDLALKPALGLTLSGKGQTTDGKHPAVTATLVQKLGESNLKKVRVALPLSLALDPDNAASDDLCSFVEGSKVDPKCPASSVVGKATAMTPILDEPLTGPVYFVKNERKDPKSGRSIKTTPKLVIPLTGQNGVKLTLTGESTVTDDRLVTTFTNIPDAPVSSFKMDINGGKKGILVVSGDKADICKSTQIADQEIDGQNNKQADTDVYIQTPSCPLKVLSKKTTKSSVAIKVAGLGAGKVTVTGKGIKKTTKTISKSTVVTVTAKRTKGKPGKVTVSFDPTGPAKARKTTK